jgi:GntR family transcriptional regulator
VIDPEGMTPVYVQVADVIAARIARGDLVPNRPIPSETAMVQEFGIARGTVRRAVELLRERDRVAPVAGLPAAE